jgi:hypothetical protein
MTGSPSSLLVLNWPSHFVLPLHEGERDLQLLHFAQSARQSAFGVADGPDIGLAVSDGSEGKYDALSCVC